jgi:diadenosine tetraphosphate (Ap4A) HIT family hydrolase
MKKRAWWVRSSLPSNNLKEPELNRLFPFKLQRWKKSAEINNMSTPRCKSCELVARRDAGAAPLWDSIYRTQYWDVAHCYGTALPGWLVLIVHRHIASIDELTEEEAGESGLLLRRTSAALKVVTGCVKTYVLQFAEHPEHPHVHFHVVPRMADLPEDRKGTNIFGYFNVPVNEQVSEEEMNRIAEKVKEKLLAQ